MSNPLVSIITPSYNQSLYLPRCLASVANQSIRDRIEHIVVDPGSTDGSTEIAAAFGNLTLIAEPDNGQSDAISKGFARSSGEILAWLNSDDEYDNELAVEHAANVFEANPDIDVVYGKVNFVDEDSEFLRKGFVNSDPTTLRSTFRHQVGIVQPGLFLRRSVYEAVGGPALDYHFALDYEYWVRIAEAGFTWHFIDEQIAKHRWYPEMKTASRRGDSYLEHVRVCQQYFGYVHPLWVERIAAFNLAGVDGVVNNEREIDQEVFEREEHRLHLAVNSGDQLYEILRAPTEPGHHELAAKLTELEFATKPETFDLQNRSWTAPEITFEPRSKDAAQPLGWDFDLGATPDGDNYLRYKLEDGLSIAIRDNAVERKRQAAKVGLAALSNNRCRDTCVLVGNGPSLRETPMEQLIGRDIFITNRATLHPQLGQMATYHAVTNRFVATQFAPELNLSPVPNKFAPLWLTSDLDDSFYFLRATLQPDFSTDIESYVSWRSTVSYFAMQIVFALGYKRLLLVGFDNSYKQPTDVAEGAVINSDEDDDNHFDANYFRGANWQAADTSEMEKVYELARAAYEADNREIVNCTIGGHLETFKRGSLEDF